MRFMKHFIAALYLVSIGANAEDLLDVYRLAKDFDASYQAQRAGHRAQTESLNQSKAQLLPSLNFIANTGKQRQELKGLPSDSFTSWGYGVTASQSVFDADRWFAYRAAKFRDAQYASEFSQLKQDLILRVADAYFAVLRAEENLTLAEAEELAVEKERSQVQKQFNAGLVGDTEVNEAQAAHDAAKVNRIVAEGDRDVLLQALETLTGSVPERVAGLGDVMPIVGPVPADEGSWVSKALGSNFRVDAAEKSLAAAREDFRRFRLSRMPQLDLVASHTHLDTGGLNFLGNEVDTSAISLQLTANLFQGGALSSLQRQAAERVEESQQLLEQTRRTTAQTVKALHRSINIDVLRIRARAQAIKSSRSALEATRNGYKAGTRNLVELLQAQRNVFASERDYANARYEYIMNRLRLEAEAGQLGEDDLDKMNSYLRYSVK